MVHVFVTAHSHCDLAYLPRLYTYLKHLKKTLDGPIVVIDSGVAWSNGEWLSVVTEHRAPYILLDAMGYTAAFCEGLSPDNIEKLHPQLQLQLLAPSQATVISLSTGETITVAQHPQNNQIEAQGQTLYIPLTPHRTIGYAHIALAPLTVLETQLYQVPATTLPDSTIAGTIEFVQDEARYYQKQKAKGQ